MRLGKVSKIILVLVFCIAADEGRAQLPLKAASAKQVIKQTQSKGADGTVQIGSVNNSFQSSQKKESNHYIVVHKNLPVLRSLSRQVSAAAQSKRRWLAQSEVKGLAIQARRAVAAEQDAFAAEMQKYSISRNNVSAKFNKVVNATVLRDVSEEQVRCLQRAGHDIRRGKFLRTLLSDSVPFIRADQVWNLGDDNGHALTGQGIKVGVVDSGIDYTHPALGGCSDAQFLAGTCQKVAGGRNFLDPASLPLDDDMHGTHVAGIIAGAGSLQGVAPDAVLYAIKVCNDFGWCEDADVIAGLEYAADPNNDGNLEDHLDVVNISLGGPGYADDILSEAVDTLVQSGVVVAVAAGNSGSFDNSLESPGGRKRGNYCWCNFLNRSGARRTNLLPGSIGVLQFKRVFYISRRVRQASQAGYNCPGCKYLCAIFCFLHLLDSK
jgi:minor extracellular serine protease Vpr